MGRGRAGAAIVEKAKSFRTLRELRARIRMGQEGGELQLLFYIGAIPSRVARSGAYRAFGMRLAESAVVHRGAEVRAPKNISVGPGSIIGFNAILDGRSGITIGSNVNLSSEVAIWTAQHDMNHAGFHVKGGPVVVEDRAWLSFRTTILPGVTIGEGAVVAAGAVVTRDIAPYSVVAGIPATEIGQRSRDLRYELATVRKPWFV